MSGCREGWQRGVRRPRERLPRGSPAASTETFSTEPVEYRALGSTGFEVSVLSFGAGPLGEDYGPFDPAEGTRAVHRAIEMGINLFDTAPYYGRGVSESRLGEALEGRRDRVVLCTKVGRYDRDLPHGFDFSAARVRRSVEESLRRLRTDVIDLYIAHDIEFGPREVILGETLPAMRRLQEEGKVRAVGISGFPLEILREVAREGAVDFVLSYCHYDLLNTRMEPVLGPLAEAGVGLINASPLHMGVLTREGPPGWHPAPQEVLQAARAAAEWCAERGGDISELALQFALAYRAVSSTLVGMRRESDVLANLAALDREPDEEFLAGARRILDAVKDIEWPSGLSENQDRPA